jgi:uncharacterized protein YbcI
MTLTRGEVEATVGVGLVRLLRETYGHGPCAVRACLLGNHLVVTAEGVLTTAEKCLLVSSGGHENSRAASLIRDFRGELFLTFQSQLIALAEECAGTPVVSVQDSLRCDCGVKVVTITFADCPQCRAAKLAHAKAHASSQSHRSNGA